ncbi:MAG TPA: hypothetical protein VG204_03940 [Terriglobia bacterium]|nr:hypothetical protein [Terriglobia bacterium]
MPLRKSPVRTPALLAANRANALKCTGPRTPEGKARVALNRLKHGRRAEHVRENLLKAGSREGEQLYHWLIKEIGRTFEPGTRAGWQEAERMARQAWSLFWKRRLLLRSKPECPLESDGNSSQHPSLLRIRIDDPFRRRGLVFWLQRHRHWTFDRWMKMIEDAAAGIPRQGPVERWGSPERRLRVSHFRLARPSLWEQQALEQEWRRRAARADHARAS